MVGRRCGERRHPSTWEGGSRGTSRTVRDIISGLLLRQREQKDVLKPYVMLTVQAVTRVRAAVGTFRRTTVVRGLPGEDFVRAFLVVSEAQRSVTIN